MVGWLTIQLAASAALGDTDRSDRVTQLSALLSKDSSSEKTKLSAIAALARLGERRTVKPLVAALTDRNPTVRALAAAALGKIGQKSALSALRQAARDEDEHVRARVSDAIESITRANGLSLASIGPEASTAVGFGHDARVTQRNPDLYVVLKSCNDDSPGRNDKRSRAAHAEVLRSAMMAELQGAPLVTAVATDAKRLRLHPRIVDASVVKMALRTRGKYLEIETELRLAISDDSGKLLSFLSGGAKVQVPRKGFNWSYLPQLRKTALENAVRGLFDKLISHLRSTVAA